MVIAMKDEIKEILEFDFESQGERIEINEYERNILKDYITNLQEKYDKALEDSVKETHKLMAIRKYLKDNEREYGSLEDNEKIVLGIIEGDDNE